VKFIIMQFSFPTNWSMKCQDSPKGRFIEGVDWIYLA